MKSVLISIQPKWCELIANGKKTIEVRKTRPKLETPFKCYIYMTAGDAVYPVTINGFPYICSNVGGKVVIGEFVCDEIMEYTGEFWNDETHEHIRKVIRTEDWDGYPEIETYYVAEGGEENYLCNRSCLTWKELRNYIGKGINTFYGWQISDLVIYDKPKELSEFYVWKKCNSCRDTGYESTACCYDEDCKVPAVISRPPQSWCYVEELKGE